MTGSTIYLDVVYEIGICHNNAKIMNTLFLAKIEDKWLSSYIQIKGMEELYNKYISCSGKVTTDSRAIKGGEMFIALKGENFDGNEYALKALEAGAACAVVNKGSAAAASGDERIIAVDDTFETLKGLANWHRRQLSIPVIGLTGTNGKTTTKELIRAVLSAKYKVTATEGNLNNDIGVPLSLLKITSDTEIAVIEMGANHPDDIKHLVDVVEPSYGLITNVGKAHLLGFGSYEGVQKAKGQLYDYLAANDGQAFVNVDDEVLYRMSTERDGMQIIPYGTDYDDVKILPSTSENPFLSFEYGGATVKTHLVGSYNVFNAVAAITIGEYFGIDVKDAAAAIEAYIPSNNRSQMTKTERNTLIVDAYNANPSSMSAALVNFSGIEAAHKVALLGDMRELGVDSAKEHAAILEQLAGLECEAFLVGNEFNAVGAGKYSQWRFFPSSEALASYLAENVLEGATVLIKGSRGIQMEKVIAVL